MISPSLASTAPFNVPLSSEDPHYPGSKTPWPRLPGLPHAGTEGALCAAPSSSDTGCPQVLGHPDFQCPAPTEFSTHPPGRSCCRRLLAETHGFPGPGEASDSSITSAQRRSQSATGPSAGPTSREQLAVGGRLLRASSTERAACVGAPRGGPPPRVLGASSRGTFSIGTVLSFMVSSGKGISVATFKNTSFLFFL